MWTREQQEKLSTAVMQAVELRLVAVAVAAAVTAASVAAARAGPILTATEAPATGEVAPAAMLSQLSVDIGSGLRLLRRDRASFMLCLCTSLLTFSRSTECDCMRYPFHWKFCDAARTSYLVVLTLVLGIVTLGQEPVESPIQSLDANRPAEAHLYQILDQARRLGDDARDLSSREEEIALLTGLSDIVWRFDNSLGRRLLTRSFDLATASLKENTTATSSPTLFFSQIRRVAAKHDSKLEAQFNERWQEAVKSARTDAQSANADIAQLSHLLLRQAGAELSRDPNKARLLFRQSAALRVLPIHCFFLMSQRRHDADLTDSFFNDALDVLSQRPLSEPNEILGLASYFFSPDESVSYVAISGYNAANVAANLSAIPKNGTLARRYLAFLVTNLNSSELFPAAVVYFALKNLLPQYESLAPELLNDVYAKMGVLRTAVSNSDATKFESAHADFNASPNAAIAQWEKRLENVEQISREDRRDLEYYTILIEYLLPKKDFARATKIVGRISNEELRSKLTDFLNLTALQSSLRATTRPGLTANCAQCKNIKLPLLRFLALASVAASDVKQKANADALELLDQAMKDSDRIEEDQDRLQAKLMITQLKMTADKSSGFDAAAMTFKQINKFENFNIRRAEFFLSVVIYGKSNQLPLDTPVPASLTSTVARMGHINPVEAFQTCSLLTEKRTRTWATFEAVRVALLDVSGTSKPEKTQNQ
jgi:hypothetical protein